MTSIYLALLLRRMRPLPAAWPVSVLSDLQREPKHALVTEVPRQAWLYLYCDTVAVCYQTQAPIVTWRKLQEGLTKSLEALTFSTNSNAVCSYLVEACG